MDDEERLLSGSGAHHGSIRRAGGTVVRPTGRHSAAVHSFLRHLEREGFDGAPHVLESSASEEVLTFVAGEVPVPPEPPSDGWIVVSDERAASVAGLLARFHRAARTFSFSDDATWQGGFTPGVTHSIVCHNDPVVGNVVFRSNDAVALIDFDFAGPNDPVRDLAIAVQHWVPLGDPDDFIEAAHSPSSARLRAMCDTYGLSRVDRPRLLDLVDAYLERGRQGVEARVNAGEAPFVAYWEAGLGGRLARAQTWLRRERKLLLEQRD